VRDKALIDKLRDALKPGDAKKYGDGGDGRGDSGDAGAPGSRGHGDTTHDGRHGGIEETMKPGNRDYDERDDDAKRGSVLDALGGSKQGNRRGSILDKFHLGKRNQDRDRDQDQYQRPQEGSDARPQEGRTGGVLNTVKDKMKKTTEHVDSFRDSTDSKGTDEARLPGKIHSSVRDDAFR
jgi:hypothetical protein